MKQNYNAFQNGALPWHRPFIFKNQIFKGKLTIRPWLASGHLSSYGCAWEVAEHERHVCKRATVASLMVRT